MTIQPDREAPPAVEAYRAALPPGSLEVWRIDALDRLGVPTVHLTYWPECGPMNGANGYGVTQDDAMTGAFGELTEVVSAHEALARMPRRTGSYRELVAALGSTAVLDPLTACLEAGSPYTPDRVMQWVEARRLATGEPVLVPLEFAACQGDDVASGDWLITPITNGLGAGLSLEQALSHGLLELVQRDGNNVSFRAVSTGLVVDPDGVCDPVTRALLDRLDAAGVEVLVKRAEIDFGIVDLYVVGYDREGVRAGQPIMTAACGEAADPDRERALRKALLEFAVARTRLAFTHGSLAEVERITPPGYLDRFRARSFEGEEQRALEAMLAWLPLDQARMRAMLADTVFAARTHISFSSLPTTDTPAEDAAARLALIVDRLAAAGLDALYLDVSPDPARTGVYAIKAIVPGLDVETMSYGRIGERTVRRLLDRDSPLVGLGDPPPGACPVLLTEAAMERLGGAAWFDPGAAARAVGPLYPLYREPGRHVAPLVAERLGLDA